MVRRIIFFTGEKIGRRIFRRMENITGIIKFKMLFGKTIDKLNGWKLNANRNLIKLRVRHDGKIEDGANEGETLGSKGKGIHEEQGEGEYEKEFLSDENA
uniref:Uncharacterized protein n=1 Tax=Cacopsylla melanoneura TaxID=428564 RepID=A0A8D8Z942_9HEMI